MLFVPTFEALLLDDMRAIVAHDPSQDGRQDAIEEPLRFGFGYAVKVFLCTAFEQFLTWHYGNSVIYLQETARDWATE